VSFGGFAVNSRQSIKTVAVTRRAMLQSCCAAAVAFSSRSLVGANAARSVVDFEVPEEACDCHVHVFDPKKFPYAAKRVYTPPEASVEDLQEMLRSIHCSRVVIVQPSVYGTDNACTVDAIRQIGRTARGVAVVDKTASRDDLQKLNEAGIRGVRLNLEVAVQTIDADAAKKMVDGTAEQIQGMGWHIQIFARPALIEAVADSVSQLSMPVVFDHFGGFDPTGYAKQPGFDRFVELLKSGRAYVKVSGAYQRSKSADYSDTIPLAQTLIAANPERIVWGTDWPHPNNDFGRGKSLTEIAPPLAIDEGLLINQLPKWAPELAIRKKILVDNPARLYGFDSR
jgi:predicted TIM-barrel fold metal-dependent hydrolase